MLKYQMYGCYIDDEPFLNESVIIYGAGKIGKLIAESSKEIVKCFADRSENIRSCEGYPVYRLESKEIADIVSQYPSTAFIITPVWDFEDIMYSIYDLYPEVKIVSAEKLVDKIWE